jgi:uncharacterized protein YbaP (TraB family)
MKFLSIISLLLLVAISESGYGQNSILWEISGNGIKEPSYLMGTLKFIGEEEFFIPAQAVQSLRKSKIFAIEDPIDHHAQHELNKAVHFPRGKSLQTEMSAQDYDNVQRFFEKEFGIERSKFESHYSKMIPLALSITMTRLSLGENVMFYDIELLKLARDNKVETFSLEPIEREAEAIHKFPMEDQVKALMHSIANFEQQKSEFKKLMQIYPHGDLKEIFEYTLHPVDNNAIFIEEFYTKRNLEWLPKMEKMVHDKPSFIALGISHLEGDQGIIALLQSKGFTLTPITITR